MFVNLLISGSISMPKTMWDAYWKELSEEILYNERKRLRHPGLVMSETDIMNVCLCEINRALISMNKNLTNFEGMPIPDPEMNFWQNNRLISSELRYNRSALKKECLDLMKKKVKIRRRCTTG